MKVILFSLVVSIAEIGNAQIGKFIFSGQGCSGNKSFVSDKLDHYVVGLQVKVAKMIAPSISRKSCAFRLPVKLGPNEKLTLSDVQHDVKLSAGRGVHIKSNLEVFIVGQKSQPLSAQASGVNETVEISETVKSSGLVSESGCGADVIVAGNLSASVVGAGRGTASTSPVTATLKIVNCK